MQIIKYNSLEPQWHVPGAREPGFMRWLISWVGGPKGYVNPSKEAAVINDNCVVGMMNLLKGQQQKGLHYHSITEIYVILTGELESYDSRGETHRAGPMDCIYIPAGVPHGVRNIGDTDCELVWVHDGIEKIGTSVYYMDGVVTGPPQVDDISLVRYQDLVPFRSGPAADRKGFARWLVSWVGGSSEEFVNYNRGVAVSSDLVGIGMTVLRRGQAAPPELGGVGKCYVVMSGTARFTVDGNEQDVTRLDGVWIPPANVHGVTSHGEQDLYLLWVHERPEKVDQLRYDIDSAREKSGVEGSEATTSVAPTSSLFLEVSARA